MADPLSLQGIRLRIDRADDKLKALNKRLRPWIAEQEARKMIYDHDPETGIHRFRYDCEDPPLEWGIIFGEILFQLRSALDNLVFGLVPVPPPDNKLMFPILTSGPLSPNSQSVAVVQRGSVITSVTPAQFAKIEGYQPYHGGDNKLLEWLALFNNTDKHRAVMPAVILVRNISHITGARIAYDRPITGITHLDSDVVGRPIGETDLLAFRTEPPTAVVTAVQMNHNLPVAISFSERGQTVRPKQDLPDLFAKVREIVSEFENDLR